MSKTFCKAYWGNPPLDGNFDTPAGAMARGVGVVRSSDTVALAGVGIVPYGFLNNEVTTDGPSFEELEFAPDKVHEEVKVSVGKIQVIAYQPGISYILKGNVGATTFAVDNIVYMAASGEFTNEAGAAPGNLRLGVVDKIDVHHMGEDNCIVWQAVANLGYKP